MFKLKSITSIINDARLSKSHFQILKDNFRSRLAAFRADRDNSSQQELESDFNAVLDKWGIASPENLGEVIFCLRLRMFVLAILPLFYGIIALFLRTFNSLIVFGLLAIPCMFGVLATSWRVWVLRKARFVGFWRWLMAGCGLWL